MRKVIDYAHSRGVKTCVGFELMYPMGGNPTWTDKPPDDDGGANTLNPLDPHNTDISVQRFRSLVQIYPNSDYYWMWQREGFGYLSRNVGREPGAAEMRKKYAHWAQPSANFPSLLLAGDIDYAYLLREVVKRLTPQERARLATGGWYIEHIFPSIDADFPKELIFASLNRYDPILALKQISSFRVAEKGRRTWMIDWWEFDGDQWFPQFRAGWQEEMYKQCAEMGVESVTLLGWKLSAVEHNVRYFSQFCWNPQLSASQFYADYITRLYGKEAAPMISIFEDYDRFEPHSPPAVPSDYRRYLLGAGWGPLSLPALPDSIEQLDGDDWKTRTDRAKDIIGQQQNLLTKDRQAIAAFQKVLPKLDEQGQTWAKLMTNRFQFRCLYLESMMALNQSLLTFDQVARSEGIKKAKNAASEDVKDALDLSRQAIEKYAEEVRNREDQGVIAQLNEQYYKMIKQFLLSITQTK
jgi:biotin operon repressor